MPAKSMESALKAGQMGSNRWPYAIVIYVQEIDITE